MNYILNDNKDVQVRHEDGTIKYIPQALAENTLLMRSQKMAIVQAPLKFESFEPIEESEEITDIAPAKRAYNKKK